MSDKINNIYDVEKIKYDKKLLIITIILIVAGFLAVLSASLPMCAVHKMFLLYFIIQHIFWITLGSFGLWWFLKFDYKKLKKYTFPFAVGVIFLLLAVKFTPLGVVINGARRWINFGIFQFQPSELAKFALIMLLANLFSLKDKNFRVQLPKHLLTVGIMIFLVYGQPNLSMTLILLGIALLMYICSGKSLKPLLFGILGVVSLVGINSINILDLSKYIKLYQWERILNWLKSTPDVQAGGYQVFHSLIAISSGGLFGCGYGGSKEKLGWLPEAHTDFIFSVISEEFGFIGSAFIIIMFLMLFYRGIRIALKSPTTYGKLLAFGITVSITMQAFFNISVATSFLPATGITLPFISYGGSSLFVTMCMTGILLNISKTVVIRVKREDN